MPVQERKANAAAKRSKRPRAESAEASESSAESSAEASAASDEFSLSEGDFDDNDSDDNNSEDNNSDTQDAQEEISVDFGFFAPQEVDYLGIRTLLQQGFGDSRSPALNLSALANAVIVQSARGTCIKTDGPTSDPFAVAALLPAAEFTGAMTYFLEKLSSGKVADRDAAREIKSALADEPQKLLYLVSERLINMPPQVAPPLIKLVVADAAQADKLEGHKVLYMAKMWRPVAAESERPRTGARPKRPRASAAPDSDADGGETYFQAEDALLGALASVTVDYSLPADQVADSRRVFQDFGLEPFRRLMLLEWAQFAQFAEQLSGFING